MNCKQNQKINQVKESEFISHCTMQSFMIK